MSRDTQYPIMRLSMTAGGGDFLAMAPSPNLTRLHHEPQELSRNVGQVNSVDRAGQLPNRRQPFPYQIMEVFPVIRPQSRSGGSQKPASGPESFSEWHNRSAGTAFCMLRTQHAYVVIATWRYP